MKEKFPLLLSCSLFHLEKDFSLGSHWKVAAIHPAPGTVEELVTSLPSLGREDSTGIPEVKAR